MQGKKDMALLHHHPFDILFMRTQDTYGTLQEEEKKKKKTDAWTEAKVTD